jgi:hypothetical protein
MDNHRLGRVAQDLQHHIDANMLARIRLGLAIVARTHGTGRADGDGHVQPCDVVHLRHGHDIRIVTIPLSGSEVDQNPFKINLPGIRQCKNAGQIPMIVRITVRAEQVCHMDHGRGPFLRAMGLSQHYRL